jgi:hypothetical protein
LSHVMCSMMLRAAARQALWTQARLSRSQRCMRCFSTLRMDSSVRELTSSLAQRHPAFLVSPTNISVLSEPPEFYTLLLVRLLELTSLKIWYRFLSEHDSTCRGTHLLILSLYWLSSVRARMSFSSFYFS